MLVRGDKDGTPRWSEGERLNHLFERRCDQMENADNEAFLAVITQDAGFKFRELDARANQVARHLLACGVRAGDRVALVFDKSFETYVALLAVLKVNAAYVPLDPGFPSDRISFILQDAEITLMLSMSAFAEKLAALPAKKVFIDTHKDRIDLQSADRLTDMETGAPKDQLAYIIYTSGTTGRPKGVAIDHASIVNFVRVAAEEYGMRPGDRCYQGMTIAFDYSVEELWVPLLAGATLVPARPGVSLVGDDLADFLIEQRINIWCSVPTLLATIERDLPDLRILIVSGEACPQNLVTRWHKPGRSILNLYGPTEATVTATMAELHPEKPVTIGVPLPTYTIVVLDPEEDAIVGAGELGEIGIAGIGVARGYLNRPELTDAKFIADFVGIPNNPSGRIYRTGDLGRINAAGEIDYLGRIDTQVKIRGYRIELTEIESVLMELPEIAQAVVNTFEPEPGLIELVAYFSVNHGAAELSKADIAQALRRRLPGYMVPAYFEKLAVIPMTTSHKADRKSLPPPRGPRLSGGSAEYVAPRTETEGILAAALARALKVGCVSVTQNFFKDLGAHSLLMAGFCADIRQDASLPNVSMRQVYLNPSIEALAISLDASGDAGMQSETARPRPPPMHVPTNFEYYGCGALQLMFYVGYGLLGLWILTSGFEWTYAAIDNTVDLYFRILSFMVATFVGFTVVAIGAKWLLIGRFREESFPVWSLRYFRFWLVKTLVATSPMAAFAGTPIHSVYLRLLGARIGRNVVLASGVSVCSDLLSIGDNAVIREEAFLPGYKAEHNIIRTGSISIGRNAFISEGGVLDINTVMEDDTQLGSVSSLQEGQRVPAGTHYHGSPAIETTADYCNVQARKCTELRRWTYTLVQVVPGLLLAPLGIILLYRLFPYLYHNTSSPNVDIGAPSIHLLYLSLELAVVVAGLFAFSLIAGFFWVLVVPRLLNRFLEEDRTYVLYGVRYFVHTLVSGLSNSKLYNHLFGDSSAIVHYLTWVGWNLNEIVQTGSNFGTMQKHENPFLCEIGTGTMASDGLSMMNASISSTSFRLNRVRIGTNCYLGNGIYFPPNAKIGNNVLLGSKVLVPIDGPVREDVGLLGSPCFEIPRIVDSDKNFEAAMDEESCRKQIQKKNAYNAKSVAWFLFRDLVLAFILSLTGYVAILAYPRYGVPPLAAFGTAISIFTILYYIAGEWAGLGFKRLHPRTVGCLDPYFWSHERYWKFCESPLGSLFAGTPFRNVISRLLGVKVGRKVFDDGCGFVESTLIEVGDYCNLNLGSSLQGHTLEEGVFKSDRIKVGNFCTLGVNAFAHYGVVMEDGVVVDPDAFVMKGERLPAGTTWQGNPARLVGKAAGDTLHLPAAAASRRRRTSIRARAAVAAARTATKPPAIDGRDRVRSSK